MVIQGDNNMNEQIRAQPFNGIRAIQAHLDQRARIEDYVNGKLQEPLNVPTTCHAECLMAKWLHGEGGIHCTDKNLLDSVCKSCEVFLQAAEQAVVLASIGKTEMAKAALQVGQRYSEASEEFQQNLAELHLSHVWPDSTLA